MGQVLQRLVTIESEVMDQALRVSVVMQASSDDTSGPRAVLLRGLCGLRHLNGLQVRHRAVTTTTGYVKVGLALLPDREPTSAVLALLGKRGVGGARTHYRVWVQALDFGHLGRLARGPHAVLPTATVEPQPLGHHRGLINGVSIHVLGVSGVRTNVLHGLDHLRGDLSGLTGLIVTRGVHLEAIVLLVRGQVDVYDA